MNDVQSPSFLKTPSTIIFIVVLAVCIALAFLTYHLVTLPPPVQKPVTSVQAAGHVTSTPTQLPTPIPTPLPAESPAQILGIQSAPGQNYPGIGWVRLGYPSCGWGNLYGSVLRDTIANYHRQGIRVLLTICQGQDNASLYNTQPLQDAAQGGADAVQCGNEEMKQDDSSVSFLYIKPQDFAKFYDLCQQAVHAVNPNTPVLLGSLDPHVGGVDYQPLLNQVAYLNAMQQAMNTLVHPGGHWDWHTQTLGLIDSWHNGYPGDYVNNLYGLLTFWAQQFGIDLNSGKLGEHIWIVEGTGCFQGCGLNVYNPTEIAIAHILSLISDVRTAMSYRVPFFYFSGQDFIIDGQLWPIGVVDVGGHPKPLRQDLGMGARTLTLSCPQGAVQVQTQPALLGALYRGCQLPA